MGQPVVMKGSALAAILERSTILGAAAAGIN
jgi:hypothetical protein